MRRWIVESFGEPEDVWRLEDNAESFEPAPGQVKIKVEAAGLGLPDVLMCHNNYPLTPPLPFTPSQEAAGEVVAVGESVDDALLGTRVLGPTLFQAQRGGLADECLMHAAGALPIPDEMSGVEAAGFFIPYQTAWVALVRRAQINTEDTLLVLGASGSSGCAAVQLAKAKGARVIAVAGGPEKSAFCKRIGADAVIDRRQQDITEAALQLTDGRGVSMVYDPVGGKAGRAAFKAIADQDITLDDLVTPNHVIERHPEILNSARLRYLLRERDNNGLVESGAVMQKGRRLIIAVPRFLKWLAVTD